jgi:O-antigen/teichoic acid export membrane protein
MPAAELKSEVGDEREFQLRALMKVVTKGQATDAAPPATGTFWKTPAVQRLFKPSWGMADQAFISLANFITMLVLARELPINSFGQFVLVNTGLQIVLSFQGPLITQPHNVLAFRHGDENYRTYTSTCLFAQAGLAILTLVVFVMIAAIIGIFDRSSGTLLLFMAFAAMAWQGQEFFRRIMYTEERPSGAFLNDTLSYGGQVLLVSLTLALGILSAGVAIIVIAVTSCIAAGFGFIQTRHSFDGRFRMDYLRSNWRHSRWLVGVAGSSLINRHLWYYMLALLSGSAATATLAAVSILLRPIGILVTSIDTMLPTHLARRLSSSGRLHGFQAHRPAFLLAPVIGLYCLLIVPSGDYVLRFLYGDTYQNQTIPIFLLAVFYSLGYLQAILDSTLRALDQTRPLFVASIAAAVLTLTLGWALTGWLTVEGAALGMILNSFVAFFIVSRRVKEAIA